MSVARKDGIQTTSTIAKTPTRRSPVTTPDGPTPCSANKAVDSYATSVSTKPDCTAPVDDSFNLD